MDRFRKKKDPEPRQLSDEEQEIIDRMNEMDRAPPVGKTKAEMLKDMGNVRPGAVKDVILHGLDDPTFKRSIEVVYYNGKKVTVTAAIGKGFMMSVVTGYEAWKAQEIAKKYEAWLKGAPL
jgi:hypothetical protein